MAILGKLYYSMADQPWTPEQLEGFRDAAQSLKLYRRAELEDELHQKSLIMDLYVDPLPEEHVFQTILRPNTTFLVGRKGTWEVHHFSTSPI